MKTLLRSLVVAALLGGAAASAQVRVEVGLPSIHFEVRPPLVTVQAGVQVVPDQQDEVFYSQGYYWTRRDDRWYRCRHDWHWQPVEVHRVPPGLARIPPGQYRHWHRAVPPGGRVMPAAGHAEFHHGDRDRDDHRWKHDDDDRDRHHDRDDDDRDDDGPGRGHGRGHGHGHH